MAVGFIIVHVGTMISLADFARQWRTFLVGVAVVIGIGVFLWVAGLIFGGGRREGVYYGVAHALDYVVAGIGALSGGTISVLIVQEATGCRPHDGGDLPRPDRGPEGADRLPARLVDPAQEALRAQEAYRAGTLGGATPERAAGDGEAEEERKESLLPEFLSPTPGTLLVVGVVVLLATLLNNLTDRVLNTFVVALIFGILLRAARIFKPGVLNGIDAYGMMMLSILILVFAPVANVELADVASLALPLIVAFVAGVSAILVVGGLVGSLLGFSVPMGIAIGLTALFGFPGTMILSQEAARGVSDEPEEITGIEEAIMPKMIIAGFSTVTITSVVVTGLIASMIDG